MLNRFALVSGIGWLVDFALFSLLCQVIPVYAANLLGASVAVTLVFFLSLRPIFMYQGRRTAGKLAQYILYQVVAIWLASLLIHQVSLWTYHPVMAKVLVTPLTFLCNFFFMRWLARNDSASEA